MLCLCSGVKLSDHLHRLGVPHNGNVWILLNDGCDIGTVIRLHVLYHQIVKCPSVQHSSNIFHKPLCHRAVRCVHQCCLPVKDYI